MSGLDVSKAQWLAERSGLDVSDIVAIERPVPWEPIYHVTLVDGRTLAVQVPNDYLPGRIAWPEVTE